MLNCPLPFGETMQCQGCRYCAGGKCWWFCPSLDLAEILTVEERLAALELIQPSQKPQLEAHRLPLKPRPKLAEGVKL